MKRILNSSTYERLVNDVMPKVKWMRNFFRAFLVGGSICLVGQIIMMLLQYYGISLEDSKTYTSIILIFAGALLTGMDLYNKIAQFAGAGSIIPITGFSNSIVSSAIEYKKEGYILGVGAKMFTIAGPVIVYGVITSVIIGFIHYIII